MTRFQLTVLAATLAAVLASSGAVAQTTTDPDGSAEARFKAGGLALDPRLAIRDVGVDTNVYNEANTPQSDVTATVGPEVQSWFRSGRVAATGTTTVGWVYFQNATRQRSFDFKQTARMDVSLVRVTPHADVAYERTRRRPNDEIDIRVRQLRTLAGGGVAVHPGPRMTVDVSYEQRGFDFGEGVYGDVALARSLNRTEREASVTTSWTLTPLTTFVVKGAHRDDTFEFAGERDSRSISVMPGLEFKPLALISGRAYVGLRAFRPIHDNLPQFTGLTSAVDLRYVARDRLRIEFGFLRDIDYSYEIELPYFVSTGGRIEAVQAIGGSWDIVGRVASTRMAYQGFEGTIIRADERVDRAWLTGGGVGRRFGPEVRIGFDVNYATRNSSEPSRQYSGIRAGGSVTYGY